MRPVDAPARQGLLRRGFALEYATLAWNVIGIAGALLTLSGGLGWRRTRLHRLTAVR